MNNKRKQYLYLSNDENIASFPEKYNQLVRLVRNLNVTVIILGLALILTQMRIFYPMIVYDFFNFLGVNWNNLTEGYKLLIIGIPSTILVSVITHIINKKFIDPLFTK